MKLSEIKEILIQQDIRLTKSLGQSFLHDGNQLRRIVKAARLTSTDAVLEIGPGLGPLTELLLAQAGRVLAIEKDQRLVEFLRQRFAGCDKFELLHLDALEYLANPANSLVDWKVVSNLPYSVGSRMLMEMAMQPTGPQCMVVTLQLEVAERIAAQAGSAHYGAMSLILQLRYCPEDIFKVPRTCFYPEPEVDSACLVLQRRREQLLSPALARQFVQVVKRSFSQRRKMMLKLLKEDWPSDQLERAFSATNLPANIRAEAVSLEQFTHLTTALTASDFAMEASS